MRLRNSPVSSFTDESRIIAEGQKDGERNIPEMGSYTPAQFEQALIANGEQEVHRLYKSASMRIARLAPLFHAWHRRLQDIERRFQPISDRYAARAQELGREVTIPFPFMLHVGLILFLGIGEFPLNTVVFRLFGEPEYLTYVMASTLAITIPLVGVFIGIHLRHSIPFWCSSRRWWRPSSRTTPTKSSTSSITPSSRWIGSDTRSERSSSRSG